MARVSVKNRVIHILDLPDIAIELILGFMSYEELAELRVVCQRFNQVNKRLLNAGFRKVERYQSQCLREVKSKLPRRESERKNHPLSRHCEILTAIETRLSLLNMTYMKYVDSKMCCFIPGKVIDEIYRVLWFIQSNKILPRTILTELRDISSMATEHFEEKIIPSLKSPSTPSSLRFSFSGSFGSPPSLGTPNDCHKSYITALKKEIVDMKSKMNELRRKLSEQEKVALEQNRIISEQSIKLTAQDGKLAEINRKLVAYDHIFNEFLGIDSQIKDKQTRSSGSVSGSCTSDETTSQQYYATHGLPTSAVSPAVFVPANIIQPNLVSLAASPISTAYISSPPLTGFSNGLALNASPGQEQSLMLSHTINPPAEFNAGNSLQQPMPSCSKPHQKITTRVDDNSLAGSFMSNDDEAKTMCGEKSRKRKVGDGDGDTDSYAKQRKVLAGLSTRRVPHKWEQVIKNMDGRSVSNDGETNKLMHGGKYKKRK